RAPAVVLRAQRVRAIGADRLGQLLLEAIAEAGEHALHALDRGQILEARRRFRQSGALLRDAAIGFLDVALVRLGVDLVAQRVGRQALRAGLVAGDLEIPGAQLAGDPR